MTLSMDGRVALVTGSTRGIGRAIAMAYARAGARVVIVGRSAESVDATVSAITEHGGEALGIAAHVGRPDAAARLVADTQTHFGRLDVLVNNAATNPVYGPVADTTGEQFDKIIGVNLKAPFELAKAAYPLLRSSGDASVINISSIGGVSPERGLGIYSVSKAALISLTRVLAKEWGPDGIRVNTICPGLIKTDFAEALWSDATTLKHVLAQQAIPRLGQPDDIVGAAMLLASSAGSFITGATLMIDAGYTA